MIQDLKNIFEEFDKKNKTKIEFQNSKFYIKTKNLKETFD